MAMKKPKKTSALSQAAGVIGSKGGEARAKALSAQRRKEIAKKAAQTRWESPGDKREKRKPMSIDFYRMANLGPRSTGLPFVVWICQQGRGKPRMYLGTPPDKLTPVYLKPISVFRSGMSTRDFQLLRQWTVLNREVLVRYWHGDIPYTTEVLELLKPVE
jgi:hypothetical protein